MYARPPVSASSERKTAMKYTRHAQSTPPRESGSTCKKAEKSRWRSGNVSQCFLQPLTLTRSASLTAAAVSQTCAVTWGVQITWGRGRELRFGAIHTQPLANHHLSFSSFLTRCCYGRPAGRRGFSVQGCASVGILPNPLGFRNRKKNPQNEIED